MTNALRSPGRPRTLLLVGVLLAVFSGLAAWVVLAAGGRQPLPASVDPLLPDLVMAPMKDVSGTFGGVPSVPFLAFDASIANIGAGDFIVSARRSSPLSDDWTVVQEIEERGGGFTERPTTADMVFGGDQHDHWHVRAVESHRLERIDTGEVLAEVVKLGFCFYDVGAYRLDLPGAPPQADWPESACSGASSTHLTIGLSVGWEDTYPSDMREQRIPLEGIADGRYRLHEIADPLDQFLESDETNNEVAVDIEIVNVGGVPQVTVLGAAPSR